MRTCVVNCLLVAAIVGCNQTNPPAPAVTPPARTQATNDPVAPDNTAVNKRDADGTAKTPIDQNENQADVNTTAKIRQRVLEVKDLSINGRNVKIMTADGKVTLRGPVNSTEEKESIGKIAQDVAGEGNVDNQLEVAVASSTRP
jgi:hyperosmotically inducible periplasmic protein